MQALRISQWLAFGFVLLGGPGYVADVLLLLQL